MSTILLENVSKQFHTAHETITVLDSVTLTFQMNCINAIIGSSGSGKSTLLHCIAGIDHIDKGKIIVNSWNVSELKEQHSFEYRNQMIGLIFQFHYLLSDFTAIENVMLPAYMGGMSRVHAIKKAEDLLNEVGLSARLQHYPVQLSGGERQRVAIARALINDPFLILADEPTGSLDEKNSEHIEDILRTVVRAHNATLLLVTHDIRLAQSADIIYHLHNGQLSVYEQKADSAYSIAMNTVQEE